MSRKGFTIIEALIGVAVIGIVFAIAFPIMIRAKRSALETESVSKLQSLYSAIQIYRGDYEQSGQPVQSTEKLGLPSLEYWDKTEGYLGFPISLWESPFGPDLVLHDTGLSNVIGCMSYVALAYRTEMVESDNSRYSGFLERYQENAALLADVYVNRKGESLRIVDNNKRCVSILLSGQVLRKTKKGNGGQPAFYSGELK